MYEELVDEGFEILAVAEDSGGEAAAGPWYDRAEATFTTLLDPQHIVTALYGMVNVPSGVWIDEEGAIVCSPETAYSRQHDFGGLVVGDERYANAVRDWVRERVPIGVSSSLAPARVDLLEQLTQKNAKRPLADAHFKLAVFLHGQGRTAEAAEHWRLAQGYAPENWNYHRQEWAFDPATAGAKWRAKFARQGKQPYYEPVELPTAK